MQFKILMLLTGLALSFGIIAMEEQDKALLKQAEEEGRILVVGSDGLSLKPKRPDLSLEEIIYFCVIYGQNIELANVYRDHYHRVKIERESEKEGNFNIYKGNLRVFKKVYNGESDCVKFLDIDNTCPLCWGLCEKDIVILPCCQHKFHIRCMVNYMAVSGKKCCAFCNSSIKLKK